MPCFVPCPASKPVALGSNGKGEQIAHSRAKNQRYSKPSHLVAKMSAATVNRRVASSNLARGAKSSCSFQLVTRLHFSHFSTENRVTTVRGVSRRWSDNLAASRSVRSRKPCLYHVCDTFGDCRRQLLRRSPEHQTPVSERSYLTSSRGLLEARHLLSVAAHFNVRLSAG